MLKKQKFKLILTSVIILIPILAGLLLWNQLPDQMVTHWNVKGEPDGWSSKLFAVVGLPLFLFAVHWVCILGTKADPKYANHPPKLMSLVYWICPIVSLFCMGSIYTEALGYSIPINDIGGIFVGVTFIFIGNYIPKCQQNYTMGIKIPWTLNSEENWNRTHRFAGPLWMICGIMFMVLTFIGYPILSVAVIFVAVLAPMIYSYVYYKKHECK